MNFSSMPLKFPCDFIIDFSSANGCIETKENISCRTNTLHLNIDEYIVDILLKTLPVIFYGFVIFWKAHYFTYIYRTVKHDISIFAKKKCFIFQFWSYWNLFLFNYFHWNIKIFYYILVTYLEFCFVIENSLIIYQ